MALTGRATAAGTTRYASRCLYHPEARVLEGHFRSALDLTLSSVGCGTYLGNLSDAVDERYRLAIIEAVRSGCNVLDTAVNYRAQRSELAMGRAVAELARSGEVARDELAICSKGGFVAYRLTRPADPVQYAYDNFVATGVAEPEDIAGGIHCMAPAYLSQQISWSLRNLGLRTLDIYYVHNPETQLAFVDRATFRNRLQIAFAHLEEEVAAGRIGCYGVATWEGLRRPPMSAGYMGLEVMVRLANGVAGADHHFRALQFPLNAAMTETAVLSNQPVQDSLFPAIRAAQDLGLSVFASASIMQAQFTDRLRLLLREAFPDLATDVQRALQFTRSLPGVTTALVGMGRPEHAREDLEVAAYPPEPSQAQRLAALLAR